MRLAVDWLPILWEAGGRIVWTDMADCILMLEDDAERLRRFAAILAQIAPHLEFRHWRDAHRMIRECAAYLDCCRMICLDHDLEPEAGDRDLGDGLLVAKFLSPLHPACPILIHTSNADGARRMVGEFELEGITVSTILPLGADWIERYWRAKVEEALCA
jgi:hypothetical protein